MKANTPEKLYLHPNHKGEVGASWLTFPLSNEDIEYIRKDAFIEKAADWLKENLLNHTYVYEGEVGIGMAVFLEDFKNAMKL